MCKQNHKDECTKKNLIHLFSSGMMTTRGSAQESSRTAIGPSEGSLRRNTDGPFNRWRPVARQRHETALVNLDSTSIRMMSCEFVLVTKTRRPSPEAATAEIESKPSPREARDTRLTGGEPVNRKISCVAESPMT